MDTKIEYLQHLERDLKTAAREEERQGREAELETRRRKHRMPWASLAAVIVALLLIAGVVGYFANKSTVRMSANSVGSAIGGAPSPKPASDTLRTALPALDAKSDTSEGANYAGAASHTSAQGNASTQAQQPECAACAQVDLTKIVNFEKLFR